MSTSKVTSRVVTTKTTVTKGPNDSKTIVSTETKKTGAAPATKAQLNSQSYADLLKSLKGTGKLWEDPDFPANTTSVFVSKNNKNYREFEWKRPSEICKDPQLFADGVSRFDVQQGLLGDCWLLAVVASLSMYEQIFKNVVPTDQNFNADYIGAFHFRIWKFGTWVDVIVDDRLPTYRGKLAYMSSADLNEFWSALLEKAYAKLCGTYESLNGGNQSEAMEDFTGGLCETIMLNDTERPPNLYQQMLKFQRTSSLMGCAIESSKIKGVVPHGLNTGHAYSVTMVQEAELSNGKKVELVRIRNPWGDEKEWEGSWSDNSEEWKTLSKANRDKLCSNFANDGEFWMCYDDFIKNFTKLEVCHLGPESFQSDVDGKRRWEMTVQEGSWCKNITAGGCRKFLDSFVTHTQYRVEVVDPDEDDDEDNGTVILGLMQKDMRQKHLDLLVIGYVIYKLKDPSCGILDKSFFKMNQTVAKSPKFINMREVCGRHVLPTGHYVIVPSTFNPNEEASFMMRIFTQKPNKSNELDASSGKIEISKHLSDIHDTTNKVAKNEKVIALEKDIDALFKKLAGPLEVINACQLRDILNGVILKDSNFHNMKSFKGFDLEVCRSMIALRDDDHTGKMAHKEFMELVTNLKIWMTAFRDFDADDNGVFDAYELRNALNSVGLSVSNFLFKVLAHRYSDPEQGVIRFEDFIMAVIRLTNAFESLELQQQDASGTYLFSAEEFMESLLYM